LVLAVLGAALAGVFNAGVAWWNDKQQQELESARASATRELEGQKDKRNAALEADKAEAGRILEMIKTADTEKAAANLRFLVDTGLASDRDGRIKNYLDRRKPGEGPVLPSASSTYTPVLDTPLAVAMAPAVHAVMQDDRYHYDVSFTVPALTGAFAANPINLIKIYSYKLDKAGNRSEDKEYNAIKGSWKPGDRASFPVDISKAYVDDADHTTYLRYCVGSVVACAPGPNVLLPEAPTLPPK
jgi:hypothetical protein